MLLKFKGGGDVILIFEIFDKILIEVGGRGIIRYISFLFSWFLFGVVERGGGEIMGILVFWSLGVGVGGDGII